MAEPLELVLASQSATQIAPRQKSGSTAEPAKVVAFAEAARSVAAARPHLQVNRHEFPSQPKAGLYLPAMAAAIALPVSFTHREENRDARFS